MIIYVNLLGVIYNIIISCHHCPVYFKFNCSSMIQSLAASLTFYACAVLALSVSFEQPFGRFSFSNLSQVQGH